MMTFTRVTSYVQKPANGKSDLSGIFLCIFNAYKTAEKQKRQGDNMWTGNRQPAIYYYTRVSAWSYL